MRIQESDIRLSSQHEAKSSYSYVSQGSYSFRRLLATAGTSEQDNAVNARERAARLLERLVDAILAAMDGRKCRSDSTDCRLPTTPGNTGQAAQSSRGGTEFTWQWEGREIIEESERTQVEGTGKILTADGRSIDFKLGLDLCRNYRCERSEQASGKIVLQDPLVINFSGKSAELTDERMTFDLNADGVAERIPGLASGSAYLVLDRNHNGRVDDGSELFGTASGDGFADLAKLDSDGNGWLDEGDSSFGQLQCWRPSDGNKLEGTLAEAGVGALWLGSVDSHFALKNGANQLLGEIKAAGVFLYEDGRAGTLQQVDLAREAAAGESASGTVPPEGDGNGAEGPAKAV